MRENPVRQLQKRLELGLFTPAKKYHIHPIICPTDHGTDREGNNVLQSVRGFVDHAQIRQSGKMLGNRDALICFNDSLPQPE
jgi:hypothetical protein